MSSLSIPDVCFKWLVPLCVTHSCVRVCVCVRYRCGGVSCTTCVTRLCVRYGVIRSLIFSVNIQMRHNWCVRTHTHTQTHAHTKRETGLRFNAPLLALEHSLPVEIMRMYVCVCCPSQAKGEQGSRPAVRDTHTQTHTHTHRVALTHIPVYVLKHTWHVCVCLCVLICTGSGLG